MKDIKQLADSFLALLRDESNEDALARLERVLDALALARHDVAFEFDERELPDPPDWPYAERRALAVARFPTLGLYNVARPVSTEIGEGAAVVGDAIDDIADIAGELHDCAWRWENCGEADALWHFTHGYEYHWGEHLRDLQAYLFALRRGW